VLRVSLTDVFTHALYTTFFVEFLAFCWHVGHTTTTKAYRQVSFYAWVTSLKMSYKSSTEFPFTTVYFLRIRGLTPSSYVV